MTSASPKIDDLSLESQSLQTLLREIEALASRNVTAERLEELRNVGDSARRFAANRRRWAEDISELPKQLGKADTPETAIKRQTAVLHLLATERNQERELFPLLWHLEDLRRKFEQYPPEVRAAWLGPIDAIVSGIKEPLDMIRAARIALQHTVAADLDQNAAIDQRAAIAYKKIADEEFHTECVIRTEIVAGEWFHILETPVADPNASHWEEEDRIHSSIEDIAPEYVGRIIFQYVPRCGAA